MKLFVILASLAALFVLSMTASASAAKPAPGSITVSPSSDLRYGGHVEFSVTAPDRVRGLLGLDMRCYQNGALVGTAGTYPIRDTYGLSSNAWTSGAAHCTAYLVEVANQVTKTGAAVDFDVAA